MVWNQRLNSLGYGMATSDYVMEIARIVAMLLIKKRQTIEIYFLEDH
jgi:hypothetical protein